MSSPRDFDHDVAIHFVRELLKQFPPDEVPAGMPEAVAVLQRFRLAPGAMTLPPAQAGHCRLDHADDDREAVSTAVSKKARAARRGLGVNHKQGGQP